MKSNHWQAKPLARQDGLVGQELPDEVLIYDLETNRAHCLNETAAFVWQRCDGRKSAFEITRELGEEANSNVDEKIVWLAVDQLSRKNLLIGSPSKLTGISRREMVRALGLAAAVAIPVVASIVAPRKPRVVYPAVSRAQQAPNVVRNCAAAAFAQTRDSFLSRNG